MPPRARGSRSQGSPVRTAGATLGLREPGALLSTADARDTGNSGLPSLHQAISADIPSSSCQINQQSWRWRQGLTDSSNRRASGHSFSRALRRRSPPGLSKGITKQRSLGTVARPWRQRLGPGVLEVTWGPGQCHLDEKPLAGEERKRVQ